MSIRLRKVDEIAAHRRAFILVKSPDVTMTLQLVGAVSGAYDFYKQVDGLWWLLVRVALTFSRSGVSFARVMAIE